MGLSGDAKVRVRQGVVDKSYGSACHLGESSVVSFLRGRFEDGLIIIIIIIPRYI